MTIYRWASSRVLSKDFQIILRLTNQGEFTGKLRSSYITFMLSGGPTAQFLRPAELN